MRRTLLTHGRTDLPFRTVDVPNADASDFPAGKIFLRGQNPSTHLNTVIGDEKGYRFIPMLVPGQTGVEDLINGKPATKEQMDHAVNWANRRDKLYPRFDTPEEALQAEQLWRQQKLPAIEQRIREFLNED